MRGIKICSRCKMWKHCADPSKAHEHADKIDCLKERKLNGKNKKA